MKEASNGPPYVISTLWGISTLKQRGSSRTVLSPVLGTLYEISNGEPPLPKGSSDSESEAKKTTVQSYYDDNDLRSWIQKLKLS